MLIITCCLYTGDVDYQVTLLTGDVGYHMMTSTGDIDHCHIMISWKLLVDVTFEASTMCLGACMLNHTLPHKIES